MPPLAVGKRRHRRKLAPAASTCHEAFAMDDSHTIQSSLYPVTTMSGASTSSLSDAATLTVNSPIRNLPLEVLAEIFILAMDIGWFGVDPKSSLKPESQRKMWNPPSLLLCAVCSSWRYLAFSVPKLWRKVVVDIPLGMGADQAESKAADLVQWIKRSRSMPLSLYIFCDADMPLETGPIVSVFAEYAARWEAMYLQPTSVQQSTPHCFTLFPLDGWHSLRRLCLADRHRRFSQEKPIPWAQLTHLQIDTVLAPSEAMIVLKECSELVQLSISACCLPPTEGLIVMHKLVSLSLRGSYSISQVTNALSLPSLRDIYIHNFPISDVRSLLNLFTRSSCSLDKLDINALKIKPQGFLDILAHRSCDSLTSLKIRRALWSTDDLVDNKVLQRLTLYRVDSLCPHLRFLTVTCSTKYSIPTLLNMIKSRFRSSDGQTPDESLQYLHIRVEQPEYKMKILDKFGKGSGMQYDRQRKDRSNYSVSFQAHDLSETQLQIYHGGFSLDQV